MYTVFDDDQRVFNSLAAGANGYLLKTATPAQLYDAILDINTGGSPMSPGIARRVLDTFRQKEPSAPKADLTAREKEILQMLTKGYTYKRISAECNITIDTTRTHIKNIYTKLHVNCGTEAVAKAMMMKLLD
jgi:DNA-binding NarL/FixJ family response regulator